MAKLAIARLEAINEDNRLVVRAIDSGSLGTHDQHGDTTDQTRMQFRRRVVELDNLIAQIRDGTL